MRNLPHALSLLLLSASLLLATASIGRTQVEKAKEVKGTVRSFDKNTGVLTLLPLAADKTIDLSLAAKNLPVVNPLGQPVNIADLKLGLRVTIKVRNEDEIIAIRIDGPYRHGSIKRVDAEKRTVTFKDEIADKVVAVPADTKILIEGKEVDLEHLKVGEAIQFLYNLDKTKILQVQSGKHIPIREYYHRIQFFTGMIVDLDPAKRHVDIVQTYTDTGLLKSYDIAADAFLRATYSAKPLREVPLAKFSKWIRVIYHYDREIEKIVHVDGELPVMVRRRVVLLDRKKNQITVAEDGEEKVLDLAPEIVIYKQSGIEATLEDITPTQTVNCALSMDRRQVLVLFVWDR